MVVKEVLTLVDAAKICNVSHMTMWRWAKQGKVKTFKTLGGHNRILWSDMVKFLRENGMEHLLEKYKPRKKRVLFIGKEVIGGDQLREKLKENGFLIEWATEGFEAGLTFGTFNPDCVVVDMSTSGVSAQSICRALKCDQQGSSVKIIVLSDHTLADEVQLDKSCADFLLPSPNNSTILFQKILSACD